MQSILSFNIVGRIISDYLFHRTTLLVGSSITGSRKVCPSVLRLDQEILLTNSVDSLDVTMVSFIDFLIVDLFKFVFEFLRVLTVLSIMLLKCIIDVVLCLFLNF